MYNLQITTSKRSWFQFRYESLYRNALKIDFRSHGYHEVRNKICLTVNENYYYNYN